MQLRQLTDTLTVKVHKAFLLVTSVVWDVNHTDTHTHTQRRPLTQTSQRSFDLGRKQKKETSPDVSIDLF